MAWLNNTAAKVFITIDGVDYSNELTSGSVTDSTAINTGSVLTGGQLEFAEPPGQNRLEDYAQNKFGRGKIVLIDVEIAGVRSRHPRGYLYLLGSTYNTENRTMSAEVGCLLTMRNITDDIGDMADLTIFPLTSNAEEIPTFSNLLTAINTEGKFIWQDNQGVIRKDTFFSDDGLGSDKASAKWVSVRNYTCLSVGPLGAAATVPDTIKVNYTWQTSSNSDTDIDPITGKPQEEDETVSTYWLEHPANLRKTQKICTTDPRGVRTCKDVVVNGAKRQYSVTKTNASIRRYGGPGGSVSTENALTVGPAVELNGAYFAELYAFQLSQAGGDSRELQPQGLDLVVQTSREKVYEYGTGGEVLKTIEKRYKNLASAMTTQDWRAGNAETGKVFEPDAPLDNATRGFLTTIPSDLVYLDAKVTTEFTYFDDRTVERTTTVQSSASCNGVGVYPPTGDRIVQDIGADNNGITTSVKRTSTGGLLNPDQPPRNPGGLVLRTKSDVYIDESAKYFPTEAGSVVLNQSLPFAVVGKTEQYMRNLAANYARILRAQVEGDAAGIRVAETLRPEVLEYYPGMPFSFYDEQEQKLVKLRMNATGWAFAPGQAIFSTEGCFIGVSNGTVTIPDNVDPLAVIELGKLAMAAKAEKEVAQSEKDTAQAIKDTAQVTKDEAEVERDTKQEDLEEAQRLEVTAEIYRDETAAELITASDNRDQSEATRDQTATDRDQATTDRDQAVTDRDTACDLDSESAECTDAADAAAQAEADLVQADADLVQAEADLVTAADEALQAQFDADRAQGDFDQAQQDVVTGGEELVQAESGLVQAEQILGEAEVYLDDKVTVLTEKDDAAAQVEQELQDVADQQYLPPEVEGETIIDAGRDGADIVEVISVELSIGIGPNATGNGNDGIGVVQDWSVPIELRINTNSLIYVSGEKVSKLADLLEMDSNGTLPEGADGSLLESGENVIIPDLFDPNVQRNPDEVFDVMAAAAPPDRVLRTLVGPEEPSKIHFVRTSATPASQTFDVTAIKTWQVASAQLPFVTIVGPNPPDQIFEVEALATPADETFEVTRGAGPADQIFEVLAGSSFILTTSFAIPDKVLKVSTGPRAAPPADVTYGVSVGGTDAPPVTGADTIFDVSVGVASPDRIFRVKSITNHVVEVYNRFEVSVFAKEARRIFEVEALAKAYDEVFTVTTSATPADQTFDVLIVNELEVAAYEPPVFFQLQEAELTPGSYSYVVSGTGFSFANSPTLQINVGQTARFAVNAPANTAWIKKEQEEGPGELDPYWGDLTNQGINSGFLYFRPWEPGTFFYQSEFDKDVFGQIDVIGVGAVEPDNIFDVNVGADPDGFDMLFDVAVGPEAATKTFVTIVSGGAPPVHQIFDITTSAAVPSQVFETRASKFPIGFTVRNFGDQAYQFSDGDLGLGVFETNYEVNVEVGQLLIFNMDASGYPLWIDDAARTGVALANPAFADVMVLNGSSIGAIQVIFNEPGTYFYNSQGKEAMRGRIKVTGNTNAPASFEVGVDGATYLIDGEGIECEDEL